MTIRSCATASVRILTDRLKGSVVGEASDGEEALAQVNASQWDVVVADISLPGMSGIDLIKQLHRVKPGLPTLVVSMHPAAQFARRALGAGAIGYLTKDSSPEEFVKAIEDARRGRRYLGRDAGDVLLNWTTKSIATPHDSLSDREYQVLRLLGSGQTASDIARDLGLSVKTVSTYRIARPREAWHAHECGADALCDRERIARFVSGARVHPLIVCAGSA